MQSKRFAFLALVGICLFAFCGSVLASKIGLSGWQQWRVVGFAVGVVLASQAGLGRLSDRIKALEEKVGSDKNAG
jgi:hypothetical protein